MIRDLAITPSFDLSGRRIPPLALQAPVNSASDRYKLAQPLIDHAVIHGRIARYIGDGLSIGDFRQRSAALLDSLRAHEETRPLAQGLQLPFFLPQQRATDLGQILEGALLPALAQSWKARFPEYDFKNELKGGLPGKVSVAKDSRYEHLLYAMEAGPVVGIYFPLALSGFSVDAAREQMQNLQSGFVLSGGLDATAALVGCPEVIMKVDGYAPQLDLSGFESTAPGYGYHFAPYGYNLTFNGRYHNGLASDYCSSGLTWISQKF
jgi:hypothetical protein